jgi:hypothetical protein
MELLGRQCSPAASKAMVEPKDGIGEANIQVEVEATAKGPISSIKK